MTGLNLEAYLAFVSFAAHQRIATVHCECAKAENWAALPEPVRDAIAADYAAFDADVERLANKLHDERQTIAAESNYTKLMEANTMKNKIELLDEIGAISNALRKFDCEFHPKQADIDPLIDAAHKLLSEVSGILWDDAFGPAARDIRKAT